MPFPFLALPYGHRQRLRELATPEEAYDLQLAVGYDITGLQPIVLLQSVLGVKLKRDNRICASPGNLVNVSDIPPNTIYAPKYHLRLHSIDEQFLSGPAFDRALQKLAQRMSPLQLILNCSETEVLLPEVLSLFPNIRRLTYPRLYKGWAHDLASVVKTVIYFSNCYTSEKLADAMDFDTDDIIRLLEKGCYINVRCLVPDDISFERARHEVEKRMGPNLTIITSETAGPRVRFNLKKETEDSSEFGSKGYGFADYNEIIFSLNK